MAIPSMLQSPRDVQAIPGLPNRGGKEKQKRVKNLAFLAVLAVYILEFSTFLVTSTTLDYLLKGSCLIASG